MSVPLYTSFAWSAVSFTLLANPRNPPISETAVDISLIAFLIVSIISNFSNKVLTVGPTFFIILKISGAIAIRPAVIRPFFKSNTSKKLLKCFSPDSALLDKNDNIFDLKLASSSALSASAIRASTASLEPLSTCLALSSLSFFLSLSLTELATFLSLFLVSEKIDFNVGLLSPLSSVGVSVELSTDVSVSELSSELSDFLDEKNFKFIGTGPRFALSLVLVPGLSESPEEIDLTNSTTLTFLTLSSTPLSTIT